jgi:hypothetical protein
MTVMPE